MKRGAAVLPAVGRSSIAQVAQGGTAMQMAAQESVRCALSNAYGVS